MKIEKAARIDLVDVLFLLKECVSSMNKKGLKHWNNAYPGSEIMVGAIEEGSLYLYKELGIVKGMIILSKDEPEEYKNIDWKLKSDKALYLKFLSIHPNWQKGDIGKELIEFAENYAKENGMHTVRTDVYGGVDSANNLGSKLGFTQAGEFHSSFQSMPYLAYEKGI